MKTASCFVKQNVSPNPVRRIFQPSELLQAFKVRGFSIFRLSPPCQTDKGTYLNLSATTDGQTFAPLHVAFHEVKFVGKVGKLVDDVSVFEYGPVFAFQKFADNETVQPLFEVLEKLKEYLFSTMEDKIQKGELVCESRRRARKARKPMEGAVIVKSVQLVPLIQTHIRTGPEACAPMQDPMARLRLSFPSQTGDGRRPSFTSL